MWSHSEVVTQTVSFNDNYDCHILGNLGATTRGLFLAIVSFPSAL